MDQIGVRELRQHASRYLARVARGETLEVTDRGRPVARLVPVPQVPWEALLASGRIRPPSDHAEALDEPSLDFGIDASAELAKLRDEER